MILFDQLRISDDGKRMYINIHVNTANYFDNIYIDSITIMTADKVSEMNPQDPTSDYIYKKVVEGNQKELSLVLTAEDFIRTWEQDTQAMMFKTGDMSKNLFFVYVKAKGTPDACTPCGMDEEVTLDVTFDTNMLHKIIMDYTRELADNCSVPVGFANFILLWNALKSAIATGHYIPAIKFWNMMINGGNQNIHKKPIKNCGCHG